MYWSCLTHRSRFQSLAQNLRLGILVRSPLSIGICPSKRSFASRTYSRWQTLFIMTTKMNWSLKIFINVKFTISEYNQTEYI